jgi:hypothetical protein
MDPLSRDGNVRHQVKDQFEFLRSNDFGSNRYLRSYCGVRAEANRIRLGPPSWLSQFLSQHVHRRGLKIGPQLLLKKVPWPNPKSIYRH